MEKYDTINVVYSEGVSAASLTRAPDVLSSTQPWQQLFGIFQTLSEETAEMNERKLCKHMANFVFDLDDPSEFGTLLVANSPHIVTLSSWVYFLAITLTTKKSLQELETTSGLVWSVSRYNQTISTCIGEYVAEHQFDILEAMHIFSVLREMLKTSPVNTHDSAGDTTDEPEAASMTAERDDEASIAEPGAVHDIVAKSEVEREQAEVATSSRASKRKATDQGAGKENRKKKAVETK